MNHIWRLGKEGCYALAKDFEHYVNGKCINPSDVRNYATKYASETIARWTNFKQLKPASAQQHALCTCRNITTRCLWSPSICTSDCGFTLHLVIVFVVAKTDAYCRRFILLVPGFPKHWRYGDYLSSVHTMTDSASFQQHALTLFARTGLTDCLHRLARTTTAWRASRRSCM